MSLTPETRKENFLARIAGDPGKVLEPLDREEWFLQRIIDNGISGHPGDHYPGVDLTEKFAAEIANYPNAQAWIKAREQTGDYTGIHVGDWLPLRANNIDFHAQIMGIDTYTGSSDGENVVGHHIDWKLDYLWPTPVAMNLYSYNNGLIPVETVSADGTATTFVLTKEMDDVEKIEMGGSELSGWSYDATTYTITFAEAPAAGTITVTGKGTENPWCASKANLFANSLAGQAPNGPNFNPPVKHVDYSNDGIYYYFPQEWKDIIIPKITRAATRYSASDTISTPNNYSYFNIGKIWLPSEIELLGHSVWANSGYCTSGAVQYPLFANKIPVMFTNDNTPHAFWLLDPPDGSKQAWTYFTSYGWAGKAYLATASLYIPVCFRT